MCTRQSTYTDTDTTMTLSKLQGTAGSAPEPPEVAAALQGHQLFVYLGHGGGEQYLGAPCSDSDLADEGRCNGWLLLLQPQNTSHDIK